MTSTGSAIHSFWRQRTRRERAYLAVMLFSLALFAYGFLLVAPLRSLAADGERRHGLAQAEQARFPAVLAELAQRRQAPAADAGVAALVQGAASAGVVVVADAGAAPGRVTLRFEAVPAQALFAWLGGVRDSHGLAPLKASVRRGPSGLDGEVTFAMAAP